MDTQVRRALSHPKRTEILGYLVRKRDGAGATEVELAIAFGMGRRVVEYHMKVLGGADLIARFDGKQTPDVDHSYVAAVSR